MMNNNKKMDKEKLVKLLKTSWEQVETLKRLITKTLPEGKGFDTKPLHVPVFVMYQRCRSLYEGIQILVKENHAEEALILTRSLMEESLKLVDLLNSSESQRKSLLAGWIKHSMDRRKEILLNKKEDEDFYNKANKSIDDEEQKFNNMLKKEKVSPKHFSNTDALLHRHFQNKRWVYLMGHQMTHGSLPASYFRKIEDINSQENKTNLKLLVRSDHPFLKLTAIHMSTFFYINSHII